MNLASSTALVATVLSTTAWSGLDALRKHLAGRVSTGALAFWLALAQAPAYLVWALADSGLEVGPSYFVPALASSAINLLANWAFLLAVSRADLSAAIPILSLTPAFVAVFEGAFLGGSMTLSGAAGVLMVSLGAALVTRSAPSYSEGPVLKFNLRRILRHPQFLMVVVALCWSVSPLLDKVALRYAGVGAHGFYLSLAVALGMALALRLRGEGLRVEAGARRGIVLGGLVGALAFGFQLVATRIMVVATFEASKRAGSLLLALVLGRAAFGERIGSLRIIGAFVMIGGVLLLVLA